MLDEMDKSKIRNADGKKSRLEEKAGIQFPWGRGKGRKKGAMKRRRLKWCIAEDLCFHSAVGGVAGHLLRLGIGGKRSGLEKSTKGSEKLFLQMGKPAAWGRTGTDCDQGCPGKLWVLEQGQ
jgi:hypothetical protein